MTSDFNIADRLKQVADNRADNWALVDSTQVDPTRMSFAELDEDATVLGRGLLAEGFEPGDRVLVFIQPSMDFFAVIWALFRIGAVPIFVDPAMGVQPVLRAVREASPRRVLAIEPVMWLAKLYPSVFESVKTWIRPKSLGLLGTSLGRIRANGARERSDPRFAAGTDGLAAVLFTSG